MVKCIWFWLKHSLYLLLASKASRMTNDTFKVLNNHILCNRYPVQCSVVEQQPKRHHMRRRKPVFSVCVSGADSIVLPLPSIFFGIVNIPFDAVALDDRCSVNTDTRTEVWLSRISVFSVTAVTCFVVMHSSSCHNFFLNTRVVYMNSREIIFVYFN